MRFSEITESIARPLYHGTAIMWAGEILRTNVIKAGDFDDGPEGVSLTTSIGVAKSFGRDVDARELEMINDYSDVKFGDGHKTNGAVLVFNPTKLLVDRSNTEHRWDGSGAEREIRMTGDGFKVDRYLVAVYARTVDIQWWMKISEANDGDPDMTNLLTLLNHPLRRDR